MNKVMLIGNLTRDPELRTTAAGIPVCSFGLAVNRRRGKQQQETGQPEVDFFNVTVWRQLGELCAKYLSKGRKCCVIGQVQIRQYDGNDGTRKTSVDVIADDVEFLPSAGQPQQSAEGEYAPPRSVAPQGYTAPADNGFTTVDEYELPF